MRGYIKEEYTKGKCTDCGKHSEKLANGKCPKCHEKVVFEFLKRLFSPFIHENSELLIKERKMNEKYSTGKCVVCGKDSPLKWGKCPNCQGVGGDKIPDIFKDIFGQFKGGKKDETVS